LIIICQVIHDIFGTVNIADDVNVCGEDLSPHVKALKLHLNRLSEKRLTVNPKKISILPGLSRDF